MGGRGSVLARQEQWHPGWAATRVLEQVREQELLGRSVQEPERVQREQVHLVLAVSRELERVQRRVQEQELARS
jgi:hypothetical protein